MKLRLDQDHGMDINLQPSLLGRLLDSDYNTAPDSPTMLAKSTRPDAGRTSQ